MLAALVAAALVAAGAMPAPVAAGAMPAPVAAGAMPALVAGVAMPAPVAVGAMPALVAADAMPASPLIADAMPAPLTGVRGDASRGRAIVASRQQGLCLLCHSGPFPEERFQGTLAPPLDRVGARLSEGQLRLRIVDSRRLDPDSAMPAYGRADGFERVGRAWAGKPALDAQQIEDVVAFLRTLR